jgi:MFS family permease
VVGDRRPALWTREFSLYFVARAISLLGDAMIPVAAALAVGAVYGASGVGYVLAVWTAPFVLLVVVGGVLSDRFGARSLMVGADLVRIVTQGTIAAGFLVGTPPIWLLLVASALAGSAAAMFQPGVNGIMPFVARDLQRANATVKVADAMAGLIGPAAAGVVVALAGAGVVLLFDAATFAVSALCLLLLRLPPARPATGGPGVLADLRVGWREFRARTWMWTVILIWVAYGVLVFGPTIPVGSILVTGRFGQAVYGWFLSAFGAGTILGGLVAMRVRPVRPLRTGAFAMLGFAAEPLAVAAGAPLPLLMAGGLVAGAGWAFWSVMWQTSVQSQVAPAVINRVTAYEVAGSVSGLAIGQAVSGPVAVAIGGVTLMWVSAAVAVACVAVLLAVPAIRDLRRVARADLLPDQPVPVAHRVDHEVTAARRPDGGP